MKSANHRNAAQRAALRAAIGVDQPNRMIIEMGIFLDFAQDFFGGLARADQQNLPSGRGPEQRQESLKPILKRT